MKKFLLQTAFITLACFICIQITHQRDSKLLEERVYYYFGEGDEGCQVNYYLQTGDTTIPMEVY